LDEEEDSIRSLVRSPLEQILERGDGRCKR
jgi:hypothetical protein